MNRNYVLIAATVVLLLVAGLLFIVRSGGEKADDSDAGNEPTLVMCSACQNSWTIPFSEYKDLTAGGKKIVCESCGQQEAWTAGGVAGSYKGPEDVLSDPDIPSGDDDDDDDDYYPEPTQDKPKKPMASATKRPR